VVRLKYTLKELDKMIDKLKKWIALLNLDGMNTKRQVMEDMKEVLEELLK